MSSGWKKTIWVVGILILMSISVNYYEIMTLVNVLVIGFSIYILINKSKNELIQKIYISKKRTYTYVALFSVLLLVSLTSWNNVIVENEKAELLYQDKIKANTQVLISSEQKISVGNFKEAYSTLKSLPNLKETNSRRDALLSKSKSGMNKNAYEEALKMMKAEEWTKAVENFKQISRDSEYYSKAQSDLIEVKKKSYRKLYNKAVVLFKKEMLLEASNMFNKLKDDYEETSTYKEKIKDALAREKYLKAIEKAKNKEYVAAISILQEIKKYRDSSKLIQSYQYKIQLKKYRNAVRLYKKKQYDNALYQFIELGSFKDSKKWVKKTENKKKYASYLKAKKLYTSKDYVEAITAFNLLGDYKKSKAYIKKAEKKRLDQRTTKLSYKRLKKNPDRYKGTFVKFKGKVFNIIESGNNTQIQVNVTHKGYGIYSDQVMVVFDGVTDIVEDNRITFYGTVLGKHEYKSMAGWNIAVPLVSAEALYY